MTVTDTPINHSNEHIHLLMNRWHYNKCIQDSFVWLWPVEKCNSQSDGLCTKTFAVLESCCYSIIQALFSWPAIFALLCSIWTLESRKAIIIPVRDSRMGFCWYSLLTWFSECSLNLGAVSNNFTNHSFQLCFQGQCDYKVTSTYESQCSTSI